MSLIKIYITELENLDGGLNLHPSLGRSLILLLAIRSPDRKASYPSPSSQKGLLARFAKPSCFMAFFCIPDQRAIFPTDPAVVWFAWRELLRGSLVKLYLWN